MPLKFDQTDEEREEVVRDRMQQVSIIQLCTRELEQYFESEGGEFSGINENGINFRFSDEAFQKLLDKTFKEESK